MLRSVNKRTALVYLCCSFAWSFATDNPFDFLSVCHFLGSFISRECGDFISFSCVGAFLFSFCPPKWQYWARAPFQTVTWINSTVKPKLSRERKKMLWNKHKIQTMVHGIRMNGLGFVKWFRICHYKSAQAQSNFCVNKKPKNPNSILLKSKPLENGGDFCLWTLDTCVNVHRRMHKMHREWLR